MSSQKRHAPDRYTTPTNPKSSNPEPPSGRDKTIQSTEGPILFIKFTQILDLQYTKKSLESVTTVEVTHQDQPLQAIPKNLKSALSRDQEQEGHLLTHQEPDLMLLQLDKSHYDPSL